MRLDIYLTENKLAPTRNIAKNLIELGNVQVNGVCVTKPSYNVDQNSAIVITDTYQSSLGSLKLEKAFQDFHIDVQNKTCLDLGAANGGFCAVLLAHGAKKVYALDIGKCALSNDLIHNDKIIPIPETNARYISASDFEDQIDFISCDLSFISLKLILPAAYNTLSTNGEGVFLIKPQFETDQRHIPKSGIIHDIKQRVTINKNIQDFAQEIGFKINGITDAPHPFPNKNQEYLLYLCKK